MLLTRQPWPGPSDMTVGCEDNLPVPPAAAVSTKNIQSEHIRVREILVTLAEGAILLGTHAEQMPGIIHLSH